MCAQKDGAEFTLIKKIGEGTFSTVFLAETEGGQSVAVKQVTKTTHPSRVVNELRYLLALKGEKNVVEILSVTRKEDSVSIVFPYLPSTGFKEFLEERKLSDVKSYMYELLTALHGVHSQKIIHRDVKPANFLYSIKTQKGALIDFGLSQNVEEKEEEVREKKRRFFFSTQHVSRSSEKSASRPPGYVLKDPRPALSASRSGTRGFRAPEVLFRVETQGTAIDIWSAGVILLTLLTKKYPFFTAKDDLNAIVEIGSIFGDREMRAAAKHYKRVWKSNIEECMHVKTPFKEIVLQCTHGQEELPDSVFDLLERMLTLKDTSRISAEEALRHKFFNDQ
ncbi:cell division control protein 7 [Nematocida sp. AWRm77]|nr:cell division control protein 7 [Nematocida sp. AWRm77]